MYAAPHVSQGPPTRRVAWLFGSVPVVVLLACFQRVPRSMDDDFRPHQQRIVAS